MSTVALATVVMVFQWGFGHWIHNPVSRAPLSRMWGPQQVAADPTQHGLFAAQASKCMSLAISAHHFNREKIEERSKWLRTGFTMIVILSFGLVFHAFVPSPFRLRPMPARDAQPCQWWPAKELNVCAANWFHLRNPTLLLQSGSWFQWVPWWQVFRLKGTCKRFDFDDFDEIKSKLLAFNWPNNWPFVSEWTPLLSKRVAISPWLRMATRRAAIFPGTKNWSRG